MYKIVLSSIQFMCSASAGRAQGVIQEVAADKIHQIAEEGGERGEEHFWVHRSATRAVGTRAGGFCSQ